MNSIPSWMSNPFTGFPMISLQGLYLNYLIYGKLHRAFSDTEKILSPGSSKFRATIVVALLAVSKLVVAEFVTMHKFKNMNINREFNETF